MDLKKTKTDPKLELEGVWITYDEDAAFKIARLRNPAALAAFQEKTRFLRGKLSEAKQTELMTEIIAEHVLLDWKNVNIGGDPLPYTKENAMRVLVEYPVIRDFVMEESGRIENYLLELTATGAAAVKNA